MRREKRRERGVVGKGRREKGTRDGRGRTTKRVRTKEEQTDIIYKKRVRDRGKEKEIHKERD